MSRRTIISAVLVFLLLMTPQLGASGDSRGFLGYLGGFEAAVQRYQGAQRAAGRPTIELRAGLAVSAEVETAGGDRRIHLSAGALWLLDQLSHALAIERIEGRVGCLDGYAAVSLPAALQGVGTAPSLDDLVLRHPETCGGAEVLTSPEARDLVRQQWDASLDYLLRFLDRLAAKAPGGGWRLGAPIDPEQAAAAHALASETGRPEAEVPARMLLAAIGGAALTDDPPGRVVPSQPLATTPITAAAPDHSSTNWVRTLATLLILALAGLAWSVYSLYQHRRLRRYYEQSFYQTRDSLDVIATALGEHRFVNIMRLAWQQSTQATSDDP